MCETEHNTWDPFKNLKDAPDVLQEYWNTVAVQVATQIKKRGSEGYMAPVKRMCAVNRVLKGCQLSLCCQAIELLVKISSLHAYSSQDPCSGLGHMSCFQQLLNPP